RAFEQMALAKRVSLGLLLLFMIVGVGTAFRLFQSIISGVTQLTEASAKAATGDLSVRVKVESRDELGEMAGSFNKMLADLAESNERRREVEIRLRKLSRAVEQSAGAVVITDTRGTIEYVNPGFTRLTGYTPDEVVGQNPRILKTGHTSARTYEDLWETISSGKDWRGEFLNRTKSGETYWAAALISPIRDPAGKITNFVALQEDVTERKAIEAELRQSKATAQSRSLELQQANVELRELDERKTEFLATVSHELRTPLTAMLAAADVIKRYHAERPDVVSRFGDTIVSEGKRLGRLIDDVLDLTKMESGMGEWRDDRLNPKSIVEYALEVFRSKAAEHGIVLEVDVPELLPRVYGDRDRLVQVLTNLLSNAVKFTPSDGAITVSVREKEGFLLFEVRDTGVGIPEDELESVFDRFYQVTGGRYNTNKPPGTGLGLAICRDIVERHGGLIWAESGGERGATVCFTIPIAGERRGTAKREGEEGRSTEARIASDNG
ncbi:MAG: ATP-binding protein, partial [Candidatus Binatia bacterium]